MLAVVLSLFLFISLPTQVIRSRLTKIGYILPPEWPDINENLVYTVLEVLQIAFHTLSDRAKAEA